MQTMTQHDFSQKADKVWQISQKEPVLIIDETESCRVVLPLSLYQQLTQFNQPLLAKKSNLTNAERIGMSEEDLAKIDEDFEFGKIDFFATPVEL